jgi:hypothetical protein
MTPLELWFAPECDAGHALDVSVHAQDKEDHEVWRKRPSAVAPGLKVPVAQVIGIVWAAAVVDAALAGVGLLAESYLGHEQESRLAEAPPEEAVLLVELDIDTLAPGQNVVMQSGPPKSEDQL